MAHWFSGSANGAAPRSRGCCVLATLLPKGNATKTPLQIALFDWPDE
jgi:hypothetical protein